MIQNTTEATVDLIGNKIADRITKVSKTSPKNNSETNKEILREIFILPELRHKKEENCWWYEIGNYLMI